MVVDMGSSNTRVGFAGEDVPKAAFPTAVGVVHEKNEVDANRVGDVTMAVGDEAAIPEASSAGGSAMARRETKRQLYVASQHTRYRHNMEVIQPIKHRIVTDFDAVERVVDYCLKKHLGVDSRDHPMMLAEPVYNTSQNRAKMAEIFFESFNVPAVFLAKDAVLASFSMGRSTSLVLDMGGGVTSAVPVHEGFAIHRGAQKTKVAGQMLDRVLDTLLFTLPNRRLKPRYSFKRELLANGVFGTTMVPDLRPTHSYHKTMCMTLVADVKASVCKIAKTPYTHAAYVHVPQTQYELPDGEVLSVGVERFLCTETLFRPTLKQPTPSSSSSSSTSTQPASGAGPAAPVKRQRLLQIGEDLDRSSTFTGLPDLVTRAINKCDPDVRKELFNGIVLTGAGSLFPGLPQRLRDEINGTIAPGFKVKIHKPSSSTERKFGVWIGGSILASLGSFHQMWFSRADYEEQGGDSLIDRLSQRCP